MTEKKTVSIRSGRVSDAAVMAKMMVEALESRLNDLGPWFVTYLHRHMATSKHALCYAAEVEGKVVGYAVALISGKRFYRELLLKKGLVVGLIILPWLFTRKNLDTVLGASSYFSREEQDDPEAEFVSLIVLPETRGLGVGKQLYAAIKNGLQEAGVTRFKLSTSTENEGANAFHVKQGCRYVRTQPLYRDSHVNVYYYDFV